MTQLKVQRGFPIILHWYSHKSKGHKSILPFGLSHRFGFNGLSGLTVAGVTFESTASRTLQCTHIFVSHWRLGKTIYT